MSGDMAETSTKWFIHLAKVWSSARVPASVLTRPYMPQKWSGSVSVVCGSVWVVSFLSVVCGSVISVSVVCGSGLGSVISTPMD